MHWQDYTISIAQIFIIFSLFITVRGKNKPERATCKMNTVLVFIIATSLLTLHLWFSALTAYAVSLMWVILAVQRIKLNKTKRRN
jgi:hypothetical protein